MAVFPEAADLEGGESLQFVDGAGGTDLIWTTDVGTLYTDVGLTTPYTGASASAVYLKTFNRTMSGSIGTVESGMVPVNVMGVFPEFPNYPSEWEGDKNGVVVSVARSGRRRGRIVSDAEYMRNYKLIFLRRRPSEIAELEEFFDYHYPDKVFKYENVWFGISGYFTFDSKFKGKALSRMNGEGELAIAQVPYVATPNLVGTGGEDEILWEWE